MGVNTFNYQEEDNGDIKKLRWYRAEDGQAECFADQIMADIFGLESRVTPEEYCSFVSIMTTYMV